ncbi:hypothetical protein RvY_01342 [Ramazzottius varieornatus]|uniref:Uncharacterized protein n=1 Tax=Ramazzottius varieornatus TaxID=947166 RepID=A0A1D1UR80_RAMVA|nr:hypothetical protein RvY_01342 [Ramazzottius varieornatus]
MRIIIVLSLCLSALAVDQQSAVADRATSVAETLIDPTSLASSYPNVRQARENSFGSIASVLSGGQGTSMFAGLMSGFTGLLDKFSTSMGGPKMPAAMSKALDQMRSSADTPSNGASGTSGTGTATGTAPRMTKPTRADFEKEFQRRQKIKGRNMDINKFIPPGITRRKRQTKSDMIKKGKKEGPQTTQGRLSSNMNIILITIMEMFKGLGNIISSPIARTSESLKKQRETFKTMVENPSEAPNTVFGMLRSRREVKNQVSDEGEKDGANSIDVTAKELAIVHQRNWFTFFRSYNSTLECSEWEFCRMAKQNNELRTPSAKSGGKFLSYVVSGVRDRHGRTGERLTQAVDCCLSDDLAQAEQCENFYQNQCLEAEPSYVLAKD